MPIFIKSFTELKVWQKAHELILCIYKVTKQFPNDEQFGITSQVRRSSVSVGCNIAEGFHRRYRKENLRFYNIAEASLEETKYLMILAKDLGYISEDEHKVFEAKIREVGIMLYAWVKTIKV